jgi:hypothetical protein
VAYPRPNAADYELDKWGFYVENRWVVHQLLDSIEIAGAVHDPCCGTGTIPSVCLERGIPATGSDIRDRGFGEVADMFDLTGPYDTIISNLPYGNRIADGRRLIERVDHCRRLVRRQLILILPLTFLESRERNAYFRDYPLSWFAPCSNRPSMPPGVDGPRDRFGAIVQPENAGGKAPYGWFAWEPDFRGETRLILLGPKPLLPKPSLVPTPPSRRVMRPYRDQGPPVSRAS